MVAKKKTASAKLKPSAAEMNPATEETDTKVTFGDAAGMTAAHGTKAKAPLESATTRKGVKKRGRTNKYLVLPKLIKPKGGPAELPELPFNINEGCKPVFSRHQMELHYLGHHKEYVDKMNELLGDDSQFDGLPVEEILDALPRSEKLYNQCAQHFNHTFLWAGLIPHGTAIPHELEKVLISSFGSKAAFFEKFVESGKENFGSGWTWLLVGPSLDGNLCIVNTSDAVVPDEEFGRPILVADVWEHAYYPDYEKDREKYLKNFFNIVNWQFVMENYQRACKE
jgi:Fe-Mn family superoxide dismutase